MEAASSAGRDRRLTSSIGDLLRDWRVSRRRSQLDLALDAGVSARHLSCVETGKSRPSAQLVETLAQALDVPLRERNGLLVAAGYAPRYRETSLAAPELARSRQAIGLILEHQQPYPALVTTRYWDILMTNSAVHRLFSQLRPGAPAQPNIVRQVFDPALLRPLISNWEEVAGDLMRHLRQDVAAAPADVRLRSLLDEVLAYPGVPDPWSGHDLETSPLPLMTTRFRHHGGELSFFSTLTSFAAARDVTLDELRIECMFPADDKTASFCRSLT